MKRKISFHDAAMIGTVIFIILIIVWRILPQDKYDLPPMIMVDGQIYQHQQGGMSVTDEPDGQIKRVIPLSEVPYENDTANFGEEGMDYWIQDGGIICVRYNDNYLKFKLQTLLDRSQTVKAVLSAMFNCPDDAVERYFTEQAWENFQGNGMHTMFHSQAHRYNCKLRLQNVELCGRTDDRQKYTFEVVLSCGKQEEHVCEAACEIVFEEETGRIQDVFMQTEDLLEAIRAYGNDDEQMQTVCVLYDTASFDELLQNGGRTCYEEKNCRNYHFFAVSRRCVGNIHRTFLVL